MEKSVLLDVHSGIATITLNRPERHNAINQALLSALYDCIDTVSRQDDIRVAIVTGNGKSFCAGIDLKVAMTENLFDPRADGSDLPGVMGACEKPIIGAVNGNTITGGLEIALNCDFLIASDRAVFIDSHAKVGIHPGWGMTQLLQQAIGQRRAKQMSFTCEAVSAHQAYEWGLVNEVVPHEMLLVRTRQVAANICRVDATILLQMKRLMEYRNTASFTDACSREREGFLSFMGVEA